jgi:hypothetical protein
MLRFPAGKYDDAVDVMSLFGRGLEFINAPKMAPKQAVRQPHRGGWMGR